MKQVALAARSFDEPDELRRFGHGEIAVVTVGEVTVGRSVFEPGWQWSVDVRPLADTDSCEVEHVGYIISGRIGLRANDGTEAEAGPGDVVVVAPGHDGWVIGDEPCVMLDWAGSPRYAQQKKA